MEVGDRRKGKLAFIKALDLLPSEQRSFIQKFCELRNRLVHGVGLLDFDVDRHISDLDKAQRRELGNAVIPILKGFVKNSTDDSSAQLWEETPRNALFLCVAAIMMRAYEAAISRDARIRVELVPEESSPKES
jgi:hypothetical protein